MVVRVLEKARLSAPADGRVKSGVHQHSAYAPVAQMDRAPDYASGGWGLKSLRTHHRITATIHAIRRFIRSQPVRLCHPNRHHTDTAARLAGTKKGSAPFETDPFQPEPLILSARQRSTAPPMLHYI